MIAAPSVSPTLPVRRPGGGSWAGLRRRLFGVSPEEARFDRRGFAPGEPSTQRRLEDVGRVFVLGYLAGLEADQPESLPGALAAVAHEDRGFAYEGAGMAMALLDMVTPWRRDRFARYVHGPGEPHVYMAHIGAGWALARMGRPARVDGRSFHPLLGWLTIDGYGFHEGYFAWRRTIQAQRRPATLAGVAANVFDQGLGRSVWFLEAGDPGRIAARVATFPAERRADLWAGIGLAAAYAGGVTAATLVALRDASGPHLIHAAQGAAFAAKARERAQNPAAHTELACGILAGCSAAAAARTTDDALGDLTDLHDPHAFEAWRRGIRDRIEPSATRTA